MDLVGFLEDFILMGSCGIFEGFFKFYGSCGIPEGFHRDFDGI